MAKSQLDNHKVVSQAEWVAARRELLKKEKEHTRQGDALAQERRELPWVKVEKDYTFEGPKGKEKLGDLFDGRSQLVVALHVRTGLGGRLPELLLQHGPYGWSTGASGAARRIVCGDFASDV